MRSGGAARPIWMRRFLDGSDRGARSGARGLSLAHKCASLSPSFLWKEVPRRGGGWPRETVLPHSGKPPPPRFARLPLPEEGARMIFQETLIQSLSFAVRDSRSPPHVPRTSPLSSAVFHTASALSAPTGHLPHAGKALSVVILFPHIRVFVLTMREYHPLKKGGEAATI